MSFIEVWGWSLVIWRIIFLWSVIKSPINWPVWIEMLNYQRAPSSIWPLSQLRVWTSRGKITIDSLNWAFVYDRRSGPAGYVRSISLLSDDSKQCGLGGYLASWLVVWNMNLFFHILGIIIPTYPNWLFVIFFRGVGLNHQPTSNLHHPLWKSFQDFDSCAAESQTTLARLKTKSDGEGPGRRERVGMLLIGTAWSIQDQ